MVTSSSARGQLSSRGSAGVALRGSMRRWIAGIPAQSRTFAWFVLIAIAARKTIFLRRREAEAYLSVDAYAAVEIVVVCLAIGFLMGRPELGTIWSRIRKTSAGGFLALYGLGLFSVLWSIQPLYTGFLALEGLTQIALVYLLIFSARDYVSAETVGCRLAAVAVLLGMCVNLKFHGMSFRLEDWHTNDYSASAAMLACYTLPEYVRASGIRKSKLARYGAFGLFGVVLGTSSASTIAALIGLCVAAVCLKGSRWPLVLLLVSMATGALLFPDQAREVIFPNKTDGQVQSLHGRMNYWETRWELIEAKPLLGYGFGNGDRLGTSIIAGNLHNSLLSVLLGCGLVGVAWGTYVGLKFLSEVYHSPKGSIGIAGCAGAVTMAAVNSMAISYIGEEWRLPTLAMAGFLGLHAWLVLERLYPVATTRGRRVRSAMVAAPWEGGSTL